MYNRVEKTLKAAPESLGGTYEGAWQIYGGTPTLEENYVEIMVGLAIDPITATAHCMVSSNDTFDADLGIGFDTGSGATLAAFNLSASITNAPATGMFSNLSATLRQKPPSIGLIRVCLMQSGGVYDSGNVSWAVAGLAGIGGLSVLARQ